MKVTTDNVDRFVKLPLHILKSRISPRALAVWSAISRNGSLQKPLVWVRQPTVAEDLHCSTDTVSRALKELEKAGFIAHTGFRHQGRHKIYRIFWAANNVDAEVSPTANLRTDLPQKCGTTLRIDAALPSAPVQEDNPQACRNLSRIREEQEENISSELEQVLSIFGQKFANMFPCLDGFSGRPSIRECVEHALSHESRRKCSNIRIFLENWLRNATKSWIHHYHRELSAPASDPQLSKDAVARKVTEEQERRRRYEEHRQQPPSTIISKTPTREEVVLQSIAQTSETAEELAWIVGRIQASQPKHKREPVRREDYPIMWNFLRLQWASGKSRMAA